MTHTVPARMYHAIAFVMTGLIAVVIGYLMLMPHQEGPPGIPHIDKLAHAAVFAVLVLPLCTLRPRQAAWLLPAGLLYGALIEVIQPSFGRSAEFLDLVADAIGLGLGFVLALTLRRLITRVRTWLG